jgi:hypothetical protein
MVIVGWLYNGSMVKTLLRLEGFVLLVASLYFYHLSGASWWLFGILLLSPDVFMIGYLKDKAYGAKLYNISHTYVLAFVLIVVGIALDTRIFVSLGLIVMAHVSMDRMLGFGLKYPDSFKNTHMQRV